MAIGQITKLAKYVNQLINDAGIRADLAAITGAALSGWKRNLLRATISNVQRMLDAQVVNVWEYAHLAVGYSVGGDPATWNWTPAIREAVNSRGNLPLAVEFPDGIYWADDLILVPEKTTIFSYGQATIVARDMMLISGGIEIPLFGILGASNVQIFGLRFRMEPKPMSYTGPCIRALGGNLNGEGNQEYLTNKAGTQFRTVVTKMTDIKVRDCYFDYWGNWQFAASYADYRNIKFTDNESFGCIRGAIVGYGNDGTGEHIYAQRNIFVFTDEGAVTQRAQPNPCAIKIDGYCKHVFVTDNSGYANEVNGKFYSVPLIHVETECDTVLIDRNLGTGDYVTNFIIVGVGQVDSISNKQGPCRNVTVSNNRSKIAGISLYCEMPHNLKDVNNTFLSTDNSTTRVFTYIDMTTEPWATGANAAYFRANFASVAFPIDVTIDGGDGLITTTSAGKYGVSALRVKTLNIKGTKLRGGQVNVNLADCTDITVAGVSGKGALRGLYATGCTDLSIGGKSKFDASDKPPIELVSCADFSVQDSRLIHKPGIPATDYSIRMTGCSLGVVSGCTHRGIGIRTDGSCVDISIHANFGNSTSSDNATGVRITTTDAVAAVMP